MIRYALRCTRGHAFESWFASAEAYDRLAEASALSCAVCGTGDVSKSLMAPSVAVSPEPPGPARAAKPPAPGATQAAPPAGPPVAAVAESSPALSAPAHPLEAAIRALRAHVESNAEHVGRAFAEVARDMHAGTEEVRPVYGEATAEEARELLDEGVPVLPLPWTTRRNS
ncbi:MAG TPA: DUF1178 family protein [Paracoccaceae bacterium]|nr:DUF1178 family protein [Paracoccaceae bacterium]